VWIFTVGASTFAGPLTCAKPPSRKPQEAFGRVVEAVIFTALNLAVFFIAKAVLSRLAALNVTLRHFLTIDSHRFFTAGNLTLLGLCAAGIGLV